MDEWEGWGVIRLTYRDLLHLYVGSDYYRRGTRNIILLSSLLWLSWMTLVTYAGSSGIDVAGVTTGDASAAFYIAMAAKSAAFAAMFGVLTWLGHRFA